MKFSTTAKVFSDAMAGLSKVVERRNTYPILANVLMTVTPEAVTLRATDLDIEIRAEMAATITEPGAITIPAHTLADILKKYAKDAEVTLTSESSDQALVTCGRSRMNIACLSPDSFPDLKSGEFRHEFEIKGTAFAAALDKVKFAISNEETRYYLNGIYFHAMQPIPKKNILRFVATDGHRLARNEVDAPNGAIGMPGIIIPKKSVDQLIVLCAGAGDADVKIEVSETKIRVTSGTTVLLSKLIEGTFPDYERVTPRNNNKVGIADCKTFIAAVDRVSTIATERGGKAVKVSIADNLLTLTVTNPDHGTAEEEMPVDGPEEGIEIGFNARYLMDVLGQCGTGQVKINFNDGASPTLFANEGDPSALYVLMPMRV